MAMEDWKKVVGSEAWMPADLEKDRSWEIGVDSAAQAELIEALKGAMSRGVQLAEIGAGDFPLGPAAADLARRIVEGVRDGRGFVVVRGMPSEGLSAQDAELLSWGLCQHIGNCVSQNKDAALVATVMDHGQKKGVKLQRGYGSNKELELHIDLTDVVGLLCLRQSPASPPSLISSSMSVFNQFLEERPDLLQVGLEGFQWDRLGEHAAWESPITPYRVPVFSVAQGKVSCRYNRFWISSAHARMNKPLTPLQEEFFDFFDKAAKAAAFEFRLDSGDMYFASNFTVTHGKRGHEGDPPDDDVKRVLLRLWLNIPGMRPVADEEIIRWGLIEHGNLGWTGEELLAGKHLGAGHKRSLSADRSA